MELKEAIKAAGQILIEERRRPTIGYKDNLSDIKAATGGQPIVNLTAVLGSMKRPSVIDLREGHPRRVSEKPELYSFGGMNYDLLKKVYAQLPEQDREGFIEAILTEVELGGFVESNQGSFHFPHYENRVSDTPLIAEFCVRTGHLLRLLDILQKIKTASAGILLLLVQLEEMIAFNFNVLSPKELEEMPRRLEAVYKMAKSQTGGKNLGNARRYKSGNRRSHNGDQFSFSMETDGLRRELLGH